MVGLKFVALTFFASFFAAMPAFAQDVNYPRAGEGTLLIFDRSDWEEHGGVTLTQYGESLEARIYFNGEETLDGYTSQRLTIEVCYSRDRSDTWNGVWDARLNSFRVNDTRLDMSPSNCETRAHFITAQISRVFVFLRRTVSN